MTKKKIDEKNRNYDEKNKKKAKASYHSKFWPKICILATNRIFGQ